MVGPGRHCAEASTACSLPPCGGGVGRGVAADSAFATTPLPVPPPQGGRERCGTHLRTAVHVPAYGQKQRLPKQLLNDLVGALQLLLELLRADKGFLVAGAL